ncbi:hypothetical protein BXZ70DRAFT_697772 [Cristinia sonorae]|uniref:Uncharacterized protein n=1 Tax=Cristinia sonorae TaxID=1940300 RepID=A0A8K0XJW4_9AGAR|nr:hypothetical protein BXZ70DRAFT_697772 [Cristinia sonorae]
MNLKVLKSLRRRIRRVIGASFQVAMSQSDSAASGSGSGSGSAAAAAAAEVPATTPKAPAAPPTDSFDSILFAFRPSEEYGGGVVAYGQQLFNYLRDRGNGTQDLSLVPVEVLHHYKDTTRVEHEFSMVGFRVVSSSDPEQIHYARIDRNIRFNKWHALDCETDKLPIELDEIPLSEVTELFNEVRNLVNASNDTGVDPAAAAAQKAVAAQPNAASGHDAIGATSPSTTTPTASTSALATPRVPPVPLELASTSTAVPTSAADSKSAAGPSTPSTPPTPPSTTSSRSSKSRKPLQAIAKLLRHGQSTDAGNGVYITHRDDGRSTKSRGSSSSMSLATTSVSSLRFGLSNLPNWPAEDRIFPVMELPSPDDPTVVKVATVNVKGKLSLLHVVHFATTIHKFRAVYVLFRFQCYWFAALMIAITYEWMKLLGAVDSMDAPTRGGLAGAPDTKEPILVTYPGVMPGTFKNIPIETLSEKMVAKVLLASQRLWMHEVIKGLEDSKKVSQKVFDQKNQELQEKDAALQRVIQEKAEAERKVMEAERKIREMEELLRLATIAPSSPQ